MNSEQDTRAAQGCRAWFGLTARPDVASIAGAVREWGGAPFERLGPAQIAERLGWRVRDRRLSASAGGTEAVLAPMLKGGFTILVDPDAGWKGSGRRAAPLPQRRARIAHELGHALFYECGKPPSREDAPGSTEEWFCDAFAAALLVPAHVAVGSSAKVVAARCRVPLALAELAREVHAVAA